MNEAGAHSSGRLRGIHSGSRTRRFNMVNIVQLWLSGMSRIEYWELSNVSANIAVFFFTLKMATATFADVKFST
jgi:hypothetical protein